MVDNSGPENRYANVVRVVYRDGRWYAIVGPNEETGIVGIGNCPQSALVDLSVKSLAGNWPWDETWHPGPPCPALHHTLLPPPFARGAPP